MIVKFVILVMLMLKVMLMTLVISRMLILKSDADFVDVGDFDVDNGDVDVDVGHLEQEREELTVLAGDNTEVGGSVGENVE